jgi:hypothetical protein
MTTREIRICDAARMFIVAMKTFLLAFHDAKDWKTFAAAHQKSAAAKRPEGATAPWQPKNLFASLPESSRRRTKNRKIMIDAYYMALVEMGLPSSYAQLAACGIGLLVFGKAPCRRTIRRYVNRIEACGGPEVAPIEAYADGKSCPHARARRSSAKTS